MSGHADQTQRGFGGFRPLAEWYFNFWSRRLRVQPRFAKASLGGNLLGLTVALGGSAVLWSVANGDIQQVLSRGGSQGGSHPGGLDADGDAFQNSLASMQENTPDPAPLSVGA